ncbi:stage IV sporulation protein A [Aminipila terrae]|uniref:stage IV sporulation protein A n=1 Tax=Aminipila terrae TaxID=2697030 RepID=UPI0038B6C6CE
MSEATVKEILTDALMQFPASQINFYFPGFVEGLTKEHWIKAAIISGIKDWIKELDNVEQVKQSIGTLEDGQLISGITITNMDLGTGDIDVQVEMVSGLFYKVVEEMMEQPVKNDYEFFELLKEFAASKKAYDKLKDAMVQVEESGYGIVQPKLSEMVLDEPEIFKQGNKYGVCLRAKAPSLHIIKTNISTEISPIVGTEKQSEDLVKYLLTEFESEPSKIWETNIFGKSLQEMVTEQMENKLSNVPDHIRGKVQKSLQKISDEGKDYFICIIL